eukprot:643017_1
MLMDIQFNCVPKQIHKLQCDEPCKLLYSMTITSIDLETATLSAPRWRVLKLTRQLQFMEHQYRKLQAQHKETICDHSIQSANQSYIHDDFCNFLQQQLQYDYSGDPKRDIKTFQYKLMVERNHCLQALEIHDKKIIVLEEQCASLQNEIDQRDCLLRHADMRQVLMKQEFELAISEIQNQIENQCYMDANQHNDIDLMNETQIEVFTLSIATQTNPFECHAQPESLSQVKDASSAQILHCQSVQTQLCANDIVTVDDWNDMMMQQRDPINELNSPIQQQLIITPYNTLESELNCVELAETTADNHHGSGHERKVQQRNQFAFGDELFSRTKTRVKRGNCMRNRRKRESINRIDSGGSEEITRTQIHLNALK